MKKHTLAVLCLGAILSVHGPARAALSTFLELPGVTGESDPPGAADVTALDSLSISPGTFDVTKLVDSTSPALANALLSGTPYPSASLLFYDDVQSDTQPDAALVLHTALVTGTQSVAIGPNPGERVSFAFATPGLSMFLELPGVSGEANAPGHSGVIGVESVALSASGFQVVKLVDSTSPTLSAALLSGTPYASASLLFYADVLSASKPDFALVYQNALVSSIAPAPSQNVLREEVSFIFQGAHVVPEPTGVWLVGLALVALVHRARRRV
jgi:type VI protein secretion system component Hcp